MFLFNFFMAIILVEAITELVVKSEFFYPLRRYFFKHKDNCIFNFLYGLTDCGYCFSVWAGWFVAFIFLCSPIKFFEMNINWVFIGLVLHRLSNVWHYVVDIVRDWKVSGQGK